MIIGPCSSVSNVDAAQQSAPGTGPKLEVLTLTKPDNPASGEAQQTDIIDQADGRRNSAQRMPGRAGSIPIAGESWYDWGGRRLLGPGEWNSEQLKALPGIQHARRRLAAEGPHAHVALEGQRIVVSGLVVDAEYTTRIGSPLVDQTVEIPKGFTLHNFGGHFIVAIESGAEVPAVGIITPRIAGAGGPFSTPDDPKLSFELRTWRGSTMGAMVTGVDLQEALDSLTRIAS